MNSAGNASNCQRVGRQAGGDFIPHPPSQSSPDANSPVMVRQLEKKEAELKHLDAFYKEHLAQMEKKSLDHYKVTSQQFQEAATSAENRIKPLSAEPVCVPLQNQILRCYRENQHQTLSCSGLAREYLQCIDAIRKEVLVNQGGSGGCQPLAHSARLPP